MYTSGQQEVAQALRQRSDCPWATDVAPAVADLARFFPYVNPDHGANEVLLLHATRQGSFSKITQQGFDEGRVHLQCRVDQLCERHEGLFRDLKAVLDKSGARRYPWMIFFFSSRPCNC